MEYLFIERFLNLPDKARPQIVWTDQMNVFVREKIEYCLEHKCPLPDLSGVDFEKIEFRRAFQLRSVPKRLSPNQVKRMIKRYSFFDVHHNPSSKPLLHNYIKNKNYIIDLTTGLYWQWSGSSERKKDWDSAKTYVKYLNKKYFAGFNDWRLPTLEEAMSLMEPKKNHDLYIDPIFDSRQGWIWTCDQEPDAPRAWVVYFDVGVCYYDRIDGIYSYVRAVRSRASSVE